MAPFSCDRCGKPLLVDESVRYVLKIECWAAYDPLEIAPTDLARDHEREIRELVREIERRSPEELEAEVYKRFDCDLCLPCQRAYLRDPLGTGVPEKRTDAPSQG